ncbi:MAG: hypothetical protein QOH57_1364, partial [Mycobacterium sp.]|nr:hypothetical protein [Mycobacterium sp.]
MTTTTTPDVPLPDGASSESSQNKHGCRFDWCENDRTGSRGQRLEHIGPSTYVPATGNSLSRPSDKNPCGEKLMTIGVGMRYNEDIDPAPTVFIHLNGGLRDVD